MGNLKTGDYVTTCYSNPMIQQVRFEIEEIKEVAGVIHALGSCGGFPVNLLKKCKRPNYDFLKQESKRLFYLDEKVSHKKYGEGVVLDVKKGTVEILFDSGKYIKFIKHIVEKDLINYNINEGYLLSKNFVKTEGSFGEYFYHEKHQLFRCWFYEDRLQVGKKDLENDICVWITTIYNEEELITIFKILTKEDL